MRSLDDAMDVVARMPADDAANAMKQVLDAVNGLPDTNYDQRLAIMRTIVDALNAACSRRAERTLQ